MKVSVLTLFSDLYKPFFETSLMKRAEENGLLNYSLDSIFQYVDPKHRIDASTFGHQSGMLIRPEVIEKAIDTAEQQRGKAYKIFLSPQGKKLDQKLVKQLWKRVEKQQHLLFFASRYEGIDARVEEEYADEVISVGDFVTMGGDLPAMILMEALFRYMPGIVGKQESVEKDSFSGPFVDHPEYTKPVVWKGKEVPEILRSGNHKAIQEWQEQKAAEKTVLEHFDWLRSCSMTEKEIALAKSFMPSHYVALMHADMLLKEGRIGTTSITTLDMHDIARSCTTYGIKNYFIVSPLQDQKQIAQTVLDFWREEKVGGEYNKDRHHALNGVVLQNDLDEVIAEIEKKEGKKPIIIGTTARTTDDAYDWISYHDQTKAWGHGRPVLFLFGTGHGMSQKLLDRCDYMLHPVRGFTTFNHLSVRSAVAVVLDKWLGFSEK